MQRIIRNLRIEILMLQFIHTTRIQDVTKNIKVTLI